MGTVTVFAAGARAQTAADAPAPVHEGRVLSIEGDDVIVDLAKNSEVSEGDVLELFRPVTLIHPVTRVRIVDRYRIGALRLTQVRTRIALSRPTEPLTREPAVGDIVVKGRSREEDALAASRDRNERPHTPLVPPGERRKPETAVEKTAGGAEPEARDVSALFESLRGANLNARVSAYEAYATTHPASPYATTLLEESAALRELIDSRRRDKKDAPEALHFRAPEGTTDHAPLNFGIELGGVVRGAVLSARNAGEVAYRTTPMAAAGGGYFVATLPANRIVGPDIEYFIEATRADGTAVVVAGSPDSPLRTPVDEVPHVTPPLHHDSSVTLWTDYADYNRLRGNDRVWQTEGTFAMRFSDVGVRALRTGFGVYRGVGGSITDLDRLNLGARNVGFTYGYVEGEFGLKANLSMIGRLVIGLGEDGTAGGGQLHLRIGSDRATNLSFGGEIIGGVGLRGITELQLNPLGRFPVLVRSEVTNQPAGVSGTNSASTTLSSGVSDVGVRAIVQVGYRPFESLLVGVRGSYQGRTINHSGPGVGAVMEYRW
jgi:hypothetical protein